MKKIGTVTVTTGCTSTSYETLPNGTYDLFIDPEQGKRFLGTFRAPDGREHRITEDTPVDILLDCIEQLGKDSWRSSARGSWGSAR